MNRTSLTVAALAACVASGCSSLPRYAGPAAGEPTAIVDTSRVQPTMICTNGTLYQVGPARDNRLAIPTSSRVALYHFVYIDDYNVSYTCNPGISFQPVNGLTYLFNLEIEDQKCRVEIYREGESNRTGLGLEWSVRPPQYCQATDGGSK